MTYRWEYNCTLLHQTTRYGTPKWRGWQPVGVEKLPVMLATNISGSGATITDWRWSRDRFVITLGDGTTHLIRRVEE